MTNGSRTVPRQNLVGLLQRHYARTTTPSRILKSYLHYIKDKHW